MADNEASQAALFRQTKAFDIDGHNVAKWAEHLCAVSMESDAGWMLRPDLWGVQWTLQSVAFLPSAPPARLFTRCV